MFFKIESEAIQLTNPATTMAAITFYNTNEECQPVRFECSDGNFYICRDTVKSLFSYEKRWAWSDAKKYARADVQRLITTGSIETIGQLKMAVDITAFLYQRNLTVNYGVIVATIHNFTSYLMLPAYKRAFIAHAESLLEICVADPATFASVKLSLDDVSAITGIIGEPHVAPLIAWLTGEARYMMLPGSNHREQPHICVKLTERMPICAPFLNMAAAAPAAQPGILMSIITALK